MSEKLFNGGSMQFLKRSLDAYSLRQKTIAENIANAETPGFRSRSIEFETLLQRASGQGASIPMRTSGKKHIPASPVELPHALINETSERAMDNGTNDVNIDLEMAKLAENSLNYKMASRILALRFQGLHSAVKGRS
ncbi:MAG: flagellar basal body rod protein FlgB [bacterium]|nr:flagellar basal body rod protein FlgB [bacterium]